MSTAPIELVLHGPSETDALGRALSGLLSGGEVVLLIGDLGAGKTTLVQGLVSALSKETMATSPSFALCHLYDTEPRLAHVDCWRLHSEAELNDLVLEELLEDDTSVLIEWGELARARFGADCLEVELVAEEVSSRRARIVAHGSMAKRWKRLEENLVALGLRSSAVEPEAEVGPVIVLGIESATLLVGAALFDDQGTLGSSVVRGERRQVETLLVLIEALCRDTKVALGELDAIAVDIGPGRFTGLRVGISAAKGLAFALGLPIIGVSATEALVHQLGSHSAVVVPVIDMRRGELAYASAEDPTKPLLGEAGALVGWLDEHYAGSEVLLVGDGALRYGEEIVRSCRLARCSVASARHLAPDPLAVAELGHRAALEGRVLDPLLLEAMYLRDADVRINYETRDDAGMPAGQPS